MAQDVFDLTRRPGLAYQHGLDWLATEMMGITGEVVGISSRDWLALEWSRRWPATRWLVPTGESLAPGLQALGVVASDKIEADGVGAVICLEPLVEMEAVVAAQVAALGRNGRFYLMSGGPLERFLAERQGASGSFWSGGDVRRWLQQAGWQVTAGVGMHGVTAVVWFYAGLVATKLGRLDWADRCHYGFRRAFVIEGQGASLTALRCWRAERGEAG